MKNIVVVLSNEFDENLKPNVETLNRLKKGIKIYKEDDIFICLGWNCGHNVPPISDQLKLILITDYKVNKQNIYSIPLSKDTVGDAYFTKDFILNHDISFKYLNIVTSKWHLERTKMIFNYIFNHDPRLIYHHIISKGENLHEESSIKSFLKTFDVHKPYDFEYIKTRFFNNHPLYSDNNL